MRQRALTFGVLSNPYRALEAGTEFDYPTPLKWAEPVDPEPEQLDPEPASEPEPEAAAEPAPRRRKSKDPAEPAGAESDPI